MEIKKAPRQEAPPTPPSKEGVKAAIEIIDINDLTIHEIEQDKRKQPTEGTRVPSLDAPGDVEMPYWDPNAKKDWRRKDEEEKGPPRGVAYL